MPWFANQEDDLTQRLCERWIETARDEVDDIGGWRDPPVEDICGFADEDNEALAYRDWPKSPDRFFSDTSYLVGWIARRFPKVDPTPLLEVHGAVSAWHEDRTAERIPEQRVLFATLERAVLAIHVVQQDIESRMLREEPTGKRKEKNNRGGGRKPDPEVAKRRKDVVKLTEQGVSISDICDRLSLKAETVRSDQTLARKEGKLPPAKTRKR